MKLLTLTLWLLNSVGNIVSPGCPNCEAPYGPYCCKTARRPIWRVNICCEYPVSTEDEDFANTPLARTTWLDYPGVTLRPGFDDDGITLRPGRMAGKTNKKTTKNHGRTTTIAPPH